MRRIKNAGRIRYSIPNVEAFTAIVAVVATLTILDARGTAQAVNRIDAPEHRSPFVANRIVVRFHDESITANVRQQLRLEDKMIPARPEGEIVKEIRDDHGLLELQPLFALSTRTRIGQSRNRTVAGSVPQLGTFYVAAVPSGVDLEKLIAALNADPRVERAERVGFVRASVLDPFLSSSGSWGQDFADMWGYRIVGVADVPSIVNGSGVVVAVLDTGVDATHPDMGAVVGGFDYINDDSDPTDDNGHGTHVAGIIAARRDNGLGITGVAPGATIMPYKVLDAEGDGDTVALARAVQAAADAGARVVNMSLGAIGAAPEHVRTAVDYAESLGVLLIAAAGNDGNDHLNYPASLPAVLAVSNWTAEDVRRNTSNFGSGIELTAPGTDILSLRSSKVDNSFVEHTIPVGNDYLVGSGTSQATPFVASVAALVMARFPGMSAVDVRTHLLETARDVGEPGFDEEAGHGMVDAARAVTVLPRGFERGIVTRPGRQWNVVVDDTGERIAYMDGRELFVRDLVNEADQQVTSDGRRKVVFGLSSDWVAYTLWLSEQDDEIVACITNLKTSDTVRLAELSSGVVATDRQRVMYMVAHGEDWQTSIRNLSTGDETVIPLFRSLTGRLDLSDRYIVYVGFDDQGSTNLYVLDLVRGTEFIVAAVGVSGFSEPRIEERTIAWIDVERNTVIAYDLGVDRVFGTVDDRGPAFVADVGTSRWMSSASGTLVWVDNRAGDTNVFAYGLGADAAFGTPDDDGLLQITGDASNQFNPAVGGTLVAWTDWRDGDKSNLNSNIYAAILPFPRPRQSSYANQGDFDGDGDVDLSDLLTFMHGFSGANRATYNAHTDLDQDGDTDLADYVTLQSRYTGAQ